MTHHRPHPALLAGPFVLMLAVTAPTQGAKFNRLSFSRVSDDCEIRVQAFTGLVWTKG